MAHATHITQHSGGQVGVTEYKSGSSTVSSESNCYTNRQPLTDQHVVLAGARHSLTSSERAIIVTNQHVDTCFHGDYLENTTVLIPLPTWNEVQTRCQLNFELRSNRLGFPFSF